MTNDWQYALKRAIREPQVLFETLQLPQSQLPAAYRAKALFDLRVPWEFVSRMKKGDWHDPLLRQVLPVKEEHLQTPGYATDPLEEKQANPLPGLLHKYQGRVLLTLAGGCAVNCRYCFRRHFPYSDNMPDSHQWDQIYHYIAQDPSIHEVIFSGGDPLLVKDTRLQQLIHHLESIQHLNTLRIHTRLPIVIPQRITPGLIQLLHTTRLQSVIVIHCNHAQEIDQQVAHFMSQLRQAGIWVLNQAVLLKGINDSVSAQVALSQKLFMIGVLPYYLHALDRVQGAAHFEVPIEQGKSIVSAMQAQLPGYLVPKFVREVPDATSKSVINVR